MRYMKYLALVAVLMLPLAYSQAQVRVGVGVGFGPGYVGAAPVCAYGYYGYYPYACAPYGYYGPSWFAGGVFIGAGPWYHGYWRGGWGPGRRRGSQPNVRTCGGVTETGRMRWSGILRAGSSS